MGVTRNVLGLRDFLSPAWRRVSGRRASDGDLVVTALVALRGNGEDLGDGGGEECRGGGAGPGVKTGGDAAARLAEDAVDLFLDLVPLGAGDAQRVGGRCGGAVSELHG